MKVGEYVRTKNYGICKIIDIYNEDKIELDKINAFGIKGVCYNTENIIKSSLNIIDLIEEDDLIKIGYEISTGETQKEVLQVIKNNKGKLFVNAFIGKRFLEDFKRYDIGIFSILTKEQFNFNKFDV